MAGVVEIVEAAARYAEARGRDPGTLSMAEIATAAGLSRSTLVRRVGGRAELDAELRRQGARRRTVRERVLAAAGDLILAEGVGALTLERVAADAGCTVASIYTQVGGRDALLVAVFDSYAVLPAFEPLLDPDADLVEVARRVYAALFEVGLAPNPAAALMIEAIARPGSPLAAHVRDTYLPRGAEVFGRHFAERVRRGDVRPMRVETLLALFLGPCQFHVQVAVLDRRRPDQAERAELAAELAEAFGRGVRPEPTHEGQR